MKRFEELGAEVWAISIDPANKLEKMRDMLGLTVVNLIDPDSRTIRAYGLLNEKHGKLPHPATLVIDREGIIRFLQVDEDYKVRPATARVLQALEGLR